MPAVRLACVVALALLAPTTGSARAVAYAGATLFDGTGAAPVRDAVLLVEGGRVRAVGARAAVRLDPGAEVVDVGGRWIVPGLIDAHVHFFQSGGLYTRPDVIDLTAAYPYAREQAELRSRLDATFRRYLASGVTAVVDPGGPFWVFEVRDRARAQRLAPRVAVAGPLVSTVARPQLDLGDPPIVQVGTPEEARALVRREVARQPDLVKIWYVVTPERPPEASRDLVRATIQAAHASGIRVAVHATELETARIAVAEGADVLVHSVDDRPVDAAFVAAVKERQVLYVPTLIVLSDYAAVLGERVRLLEVERRFGDPDAIASWRGMAAARALVPPERARAREERLRRAEGVMAANLRALRDAGVRIAAGTDAGNIGTLHGPSLHRELQRMAEAGLTPREVLLAATRDAARVFARSPEIGTLEVGQRADFLVLGADPLADVANLTRIDRVVKGGEPLVPSELVPPPAR